MKKKANASTVENMKQNRHFSRTETFVNGVPWVVAQSKIDILKCGTRVLDFGNLWGDVVNAEWLSGVQVRCIERRRLRRLCRH
jgi:hypothetical protein